MTGEAAPLLRLDGVTRRFGGLLAVDGLSFELHAGEILGLIGPNGAGKTTCFNLIAGALRPDAGSIRLDGEELTGLRPHQIARRGIMRTFQHNMAFPGMTVTQNVLVGAHTGMTQGLLSVFAGLPGARREEEAAVARAVELVRFVGLSDWVEADVSTLSFGQGRLLETARALAGEPRAILFDEPAAGLTLHEAGQLSTIIRDIADRGIAVLVIEHDMRFLMPLAQRVVVLNFGAKIADGIPTAIQDDPAVIDAYLGEPGDSRGAGAADA